MKNDNDAAALGAGLLQRCGRSAHSRGVAVHMCAGAEQVERLEWLGELIAAGTSGAARPIKATASLPDEATALFMERRAERQAKAGCVGIQQVRSTPVGGIAHERCLRIEEC
eukprot:SAG11_NODE_588_length_8329_cov_18.642857_2_plen_112_part_00